MTSKKKQFDNKNQKDIGVLYIRYDKNSLCGQIIENRKKEVGYQLNKQVLKLILLAEIVEPLSYFGVDLETLSQAYYESLKLFSDKLEQANYKISTLTAQITRRKNRVAAFSVKQEAETFTTLIFNQSENLIDDESSRPIAIKSHF